MTKRARLNLADEMARGCLYRGGASEDQFLKGYLDAAKVFYSLFFVAYGIECLLKWLRS